MDKPQHTPLQSKAFSLGKRRGAGFYLEEGAGVGFYRTSMLLGCLLGIGMNARTASSRKKCCPVSHTKWFQQNYKLSLTKA